MPSQVESWFAALPGKLQREMVTKFRARVDNARDVIAAAAPEKSGRLKSTVRVRRRRGSLSLEILAGGPATTKPVRKGASATYDYALAAEFGTEHQAAQPWFFATWEGGLRQETEAGIRADVEDIISRA